MKQTKSSKKTVSKQSLIARHRRIWLAVVGGLATAIVVVAGLQAYARYRMVYDAAELASALQIRSMIVDAVKGLKNDAPVDPKTGDVYFPQAKLYLPDVPQRAGLTYSYDTFDNVTEFSISSHAALSAAGSRMYRAKVSEVFEGAPLLQACQRGLRLTYDNSAFNDQPDVRQLKSVHLNNGRILYVFGENCQALEEQVLPLLDKLQTY